MAEQPARGFGGVVRALRKQHEAAMAHTDATVRALHVLGVAGSAGLTAGDFGAALWAPGERSGPISPTRGGGDYAAQMLLGRLKAKGLVESHYPRDGGATRWSLADEGLRVLAVRTKGGGRG